MAKPDRPGGENDGERRGGPGGPGGGGPGPQGGGGPGPQGGGPGPVGGPPGNPPPGAPQVGAAQSPGDWQRARPDMADKTAYSAWSDLNKEAGKNRTDYSALSRPWDANKYNQDEAYRSHRSPRT